MSSAGDYDYTRDPLFAGLVDEVDIQALADTLPDTIDIEELLDNINNEANDKLLDRTLSDVHAERNRVLQSVGLPREELKSMNKKLRNYMYIDELRDLTYGAYLRWLPLNPEAEPYLRRGGFLVDVDFVERGVNLRVLTLARTHATVSFDANIVFQKLTESNLLLLELVNHIKRV